MNTKSTTPIDVMIGNNIRAVRKLRGMSKLVADGEEVILEGPAQ